MKTLFRNLLTTIFILAIVCIASNAQSLQERLNPLKPFLGRTWKGDLKAPNGELISVSVRNFESIADGKVIKIIKKSEGKSDWGEGCFYWNDIEKKIAYFFIEGAGVFQTGFVKVENNAITIEGTMTWPTQMNPQVKQSYEFKNTFEFTSDGKMIDKWFMNAFGPWQPGHVIEFIGY